MKRIFFILFFLIFVMNTSAQKLEGNFTDASKIKLDISKLSRNPTWVLKVMRNEIYARYGYKFKSIEMREYFSSYGWYKPKYNDVSHMLSDIEKHNINLIRKVETEFLQSIEEINQNRRYSEDTYFQFDKNGFVLKSVDYSIKRFRVKSKVSSFLIKKAKSTQTDYRIDGNSSFISTDIFKFKNNNISFYKHLVVAGKKIEFLQGNNRIIYCVNMDEGPGTIYQLIDLEKFTPFILYNRENQCYKLRYKHKPARWISIYSEKIGNTSDIWIYDRDASVRSPIINNKEYFQLASIIYANEDSVFQIIDAYKPFDSKIRRKNVYIDLKFPENNQPVKMYLDRNDIWLEDTSNGFSDFKIEFNINGESIFLPVENNNIIINNKAMKNGIIIKKRDLTKYLSNSY